MSKLKKASQELTEVFKNLLDEYTVQSFLPIADNNNSTTNSFTNDQYAIKEVSENQEKELIESSKPKPCQCGKNCQKQFSANELFAARANSRTLSRDSKNCSDFISIAFMSNNV
jgi:hypothetical protein